jgi:hypothetical protein
LPLSLQFVTVAQRNVITVFAAIAVFATLA